jgi:hypothetical protein
MSEQRGNMPAMPHRFEHVLDAEIIIHQAFCANANNMKWLLNLFKSEPPPPPIQHPLIGELVGSRSLNGKVCSWETAKLVDTAIGPLKVSFSAGIDGPTDEQLRRWHEIRGNLIQFRIDADPFIEGWLSDLETDLAVELVKATEIRIWDDPEVMPDWSIHFYLSSHCWAFTVTFEGDKAAHSDFDRDA